MQDILLGYIENADPGYSGGEIENKLKVKLKYEIINHNKSIIDKLPIDDAWPPLSKKMFSSIPDKHLLTYKNSLLIFGGSFKSICLEWPQWLNKFENLLSQMYWESVNIYLKSEMVGRHHFEWTPKREWVEKMCNRELEKILDWNFKGIRDFSDNKSK